MYPLRGTEMMLTGGRASACIGLVIPALSLTFDCRFEYVNFRIIYSNAYFESIHQGHTSFKNVCKSKDPKTDPCGIHI